MKATDRSVVGLPSYLAHRWALTLLAVAAVVAAILPSREDLARRLLASNQVAPARPLLEGALASTSDPAHRARLHELLGQLAEGAGDADGARTHLAGARQDRGSLRLLVEQARLERLLDHPAEETAALVEAEALYAAWKKTGQPGLAVITDGLPLLKPHELPLPAKLATAFEAWYRPHRRRLASLLRWRQQLAPARALYRELAAAAPDDLALWSQLERLEIYSGDREASNKALAHMARLAPQDARTQQRLAFRALEAKDAAGLARHLAAAKLSPAEVRHQVLAMLVASPGDARARYRELVPGDADEDAIARELAEAHAQAGHGAEAAAAWTALARAHPEDAALQRRLAEMLFDAKRYREGADLLIKLVQGPAKVDGDLTRALEALRELPSEEAIPRLEFLHEKGAAVARDLGIRLAELKRYDRAVALLEPVVKARPSDGDAAFHLATALGEVGRGPEAIAMFRTVIRADTMPAAPAAALAVAGGAAAQASLAALAVRAAAPATGPVSRRVLALHKKSEGDSTDRNLVHARLEVALEHLGLAVDHRAVEDGLPATAELAAYRGVVTWFRTGDMRGATAYARWLDGVLAAAVPVLVMDQLGCVRDPAGTVDASALDAVWRRMGLRPGPRWSDDPTRFTVASADKSLCDFERPLAYELESFHERTSISPGNQVLLRLKAKDDDRVISDAIVAGPWGALVEGDYAFYEDPDLDAHAWRVNPFALAARAFKTDGLPRLDVTTVLGRRLALVHIDGDASDQPLADRPQETCIEDFHDRVLPRRHLPHTVSLIGRLVDPAFNPAPRPLTAARRVLAHPLVEPAHHSYSHPFDWKKSDVTLATTGYTTMDPEREIAGARDVLDRLICPPDKPVKLFLWSGLCNPTASQVAVADRAGLPNFNGGDPRCDAYHPSVSHLAPLHRFQAGHAQALTPSANDFVYTDYWTLPRLAFGAVIGSWQRTETPRRLTPVNLYYHFYLLAEAGGRAVLDRIYDWMEGQELYPGFASEYVAAGRGWRAATLTRRHDGAWVIARNGACRTVRFDDEARQIDWARSRGVLGQRRVARNLYVHLADAAECVVALAADVTAQPHVAASSAEIRSASTTAGAFAFEALARVPARVALSGGAPGTRCTVQVDSSSVERVWSPAGELTVELPAGTWRVRVTPRLSASL